MNKEQVKELAEINATYTFDRATRQYGEFTDEYIRHFYNKLAELRGGIDDNHARNCQYNNNSRDNEPCCRCDSRQTNADRIRNMSDEELAELLFNKSRCDNCFANCNDKDNCPSLGSCYSKHLKWLQAKAE